MLKKDYQSKIITSNKINNKILLLQQIFQY